MQLQLNQLTADLRAILDLAQQEAAYRHAPYVDVEHLALGLFQHPAGTAHTLFEQHNVDSAALYVQIAGAVGMKRDDPIAIKGYTNAANAALQRALDEARKQGHIPLAAGHLLIAFMDETEGVIHEVLADLPFDVAAVREYLLNIDPPKLASDARPLIPIPKTGRANPRDDAPPEIIVIPTRQSRQKQRQANAKPASNVPLIIAAALVLIAYMVVTLPTASIFVFVFVIIGWVFSVTLHEFSHAIVAYYGGDYTVADKGYLSFNPLRYAHPFLSVILPLIFLAMGGIGLPGGAVYIEEHRLRTKWWGAAVSAAGPASNMLLAILLSLPFITGLVDVDKMRDMESFDQNRDYYLRTYPEYSETQLRYLANADDDHSIWSNRTLWYTMALLAMLQVTATFFNLLPIPPFDGFGLLQPYMSREAFMQMRQIGMLGLLLVIFMMNTEFGQQFWDLIYSVTDTLHIPGWMINQGLNLFQFWMGDN
ncbi:MAG: hypothetical protein JXA10_12770 [Anaerolineae bacterium]|nr:hypothetical protein [Anaerolineae bacterium]